MSSDLPVIKAVSAQAERDGRYVPPPSKSTFMAEALCPSCAIKLPIRKTMQSAA
jgi:hypothetical protein